VGPTFDGRIKPDVVAPGTNIISSYSSYYLESYPTANDISWDVEHFDFNGRTYAWNTNTGTSMSTPVVAGAIALWLQANPRLTPNDVMGVIRRTSTRVDESLSYPNIYYGYGQVDVYKGLLDVLGAVGIQGVSDYQPKAVTIHPTADGLVNITFGQMPQHPFSVQVFHVSGSLLRTFTLPADQATATIDLRDLPHGVYVIQVNGPTPESKGSTLVRL
jgi:subtilisin family serine protease